MLKNKRLLFSLVGVLSLVALAGTIFILKGSGQNNVNRQSTRILRKESQSRIPTDPSDKELDDAATPIVDYTSSADPTHADKDARYNNYHLVLSNPSPKVSEVASDKALSTNDLPFADSDAVIEGKVISSSAHLSTDKEAVYSEYTIRIQGIHKNTPDEQINKHGEIVVDRLGGRVRYPNGQIVRYKVAGQGSPIIDGDYLLFLKRNDKGDYRIVTGYQMQGNRVLALDGSRINFRGASKSSFDKHNNKDLKDFRKELEDSKKKPASNKPVEREG